MLSCVLYRTVIDQASATGDGTGIVILKSIGKFLLMFGCSALIGIVMAILSALVRPHTILHMCYYTFTVSAFPDDQARCTSSASLLRATHDLDFCLSSLLHS